MSVLLPMYPVKASTLIENCRYIPLETNEESITGDILRLLPVQNGFFTLDRFQQLSYFDADGKFIHRIAKKGNGPGEYVNLLGFDLSERDEIIYLHDNKNQILLYSFDNKYLRSIKLERNVTKIMKTSWGYICYIDPLLNFGNKTEVLLTLDEDGNKLNILQYRKVDIAQFSPWVVSPFIEKINDKYYYYPPYQDTLYSVLINKIVPVYVFPKGKYNIAIEELATLEMSRSAKARGLRLGDFIMDDHCLIFYCNRQNNQETYLYDFTSEKLYCVSEIVNDIDNSYNFLPKLVFKNQWIEIKSAYDIFEESTVLPVALKNLNPDDNPVIRISKTRVSSSPE